MALHRLTTITIGVPNVDTTREFYRDFGLSELAPGRFATSDGGEQLRIAQAPRRNLLELGLGVDDADDLRRLAANLAQIGVASSLDATTLRSADPATAVAIVVTVAARLRQVTAAAPDTNRPGHALRRNARADAVTRRGAVVPRKLSHVVLGSTDAALSRRFFVDGLGFHVSDEIPDVGAAFMRCSTDHHNLLVQPAPLTFLHHTAWEVADVDEVGRGATRMLAKDPARHVWGLGRHAIGSNYFWYLRDPAGNFAEYASDLDIIDDPAWKPETWSGLQSLMSWGPQAPPSFLAPDDLAALMAA